MLTGALRSAIKVYFFSYDRRVSGAGRGLEVLDGEPGAPVLYQQNTVHNVLHPAGNRTDLRAVRPVHLHLALGLKKLKGLKALRALRCAPGGFQATIKMSR
ncbi:hypothetical protein NDU88_006937 [Pleurodeles waltl]|uniref:Uncharacterized protein n=1 Tax=Pleurodeles waltl TaxID=8319 RepID=A0AAV7MEM6_PLEWA|nr:hypothetical protein NDU88_006937 [Pleurodeles waltl]